MHMHMLLLTKWGTELEDLIAPAEEFSLASLEEALWVQIQVLCEAKFIMGYKNDNSSPLCEF